MFKSSEVNESSADWKISTAPLVIGGLTVYTQADYPENFLEKMDTIACTQCVKLFRITFLRFASSERGIFKKFIKLPESKSLPESLSRLRWSYQVDISRWLSILSISVGSTAENLFTILQYSTIFSLFLACAFEPVSHPGLDLFHSLYFPVQHFSRFDSVFSYNFCVHLRLVRNTTGSPLKMRSCSLVPLLKLRSYRWIVRPLIRGIFFWS